MAQQHDQLTPSIPTQAEESPAMAQPKKGPANPPTHPLAQEAAVAPGRNVDSFVKAFLFELNLELGVSLEESTVNDQYLALARTVREYLLADWLRTKKERLATSPKVVGYLSAEYLLGRQLGNSILAADLEELAAEAMKTLGIDLQTMRNQEIEPGLGNGGLGRLAACFIDSMATLDIPSIGYGIRYKYGIFKQVFENGHQKELPDKWLELGDPWEFPFPDRAVTVGFGGHVEVYTDSDGAQRRHWVPQQKVVGVPYQYMVPGYRNGVVNTLRLWSAKATNAFDLEIFNAGDHAAAVQAQTYAETITKVLYPEDSTPQGRELRLQQQYFFVACSLHDFIHQSMAQGFDVHDLPDRIVYQLNDTHPVIAIPELMRMLLDDHNLPWNEAWDITSRCFAYTCHTLLPEALEIWPVELVSRLLPRHMEIIYRINSDFLDTVRAAYPGDDDRVRRMSIIAEGAEKGVRMAHLAVVAATKVNGVAELQSQLLRDDVLPDFAGLWPHKFTNVTNGISPRRFIRYSNPSLSQLITERIGDGWVADLDQLQQIEPLADDAEFRAAFWNTKEVNRERLRQTLKARDGIELPEGHMIDVMVKRLHEYKRQTLKMLHVVSLYEQIKCGELDVADVTPRTVIFGAKAAPGYTMAKEIIALINGVAATLDADPHVRDTLKIAFPANYNVTLAEKLIPAADLSEQISLAGKEASGTGNMKFMLNGALTIGTDDGANVEIRQLVGDEHFFLFGMNEPEVSKLRTEGYKPQDVCAGDEQLGRALDMLASGLFTGGDAEAARVVVDDLRHEDKYMVCADFRAYMDAQERAERHFCDRDAWARSAIVNIAKAGFFSSDRSMRQYAERIWDIK